MILTDASAWVEFLRGTGGPAHRTVRRVLSEGGEIVTTDVVVMEILAGARDDLEFARLRSRLRAFPCLPADGPEDFEAAAALHRACRAGGETVRRLIDCLIAAVAIRATVPVLHADRDFEVIARHSPLRVMPLDPPV